MEWCGLDWCAHDRRKWRALVNVVMNLQVLKDPGKLWSGYTTLGISSSAQLHYFS
jgi:hypothetical protein